MLGRRTTDPALQGFDFTERLNRDRAILEGRMVDPRLLDDYLDDETAENLDRIMTKPEAGEPTQDAPATDDLDAGFAEDAAGFDDADSTADRAEEIADSVIETTDHLAADEDAAFVAIRAAKENAYDDWEGLSGSDPTAKTPWMDRLRAWLMSAVRGLVWMFITMWTLDKLHLFEAGFARFDITGTSAQFYLAGISVLALASLLIYLTKAIRTAIHPELWRSTASGLTLGGLIGAIDGFGPSHHFLTMVAELGRLI